MISVNYMGRLGNCLLQYSAARIFALKYGLLLDQVSNDYIFEIAGSSVNLYTQAGSNKSGNKKILLRENDYMELIKLDNIDPNHYVINDFFQNPDFVSLFAEEIKSTIKIPQAKRISGSVLCHARLGDCDNTTRRLPYEYYREALRSLTFDNGVITSDSPAHPDIKSLADEFKLEISDLSPIETLLISNMYEKCVLSEGSFSWWIGLLSGASEILINKRLRKNAWHGDIFVFPEWKQTNYCL